MDSDLHNTGIEIVPVGKVSSELLEYLALTTSANLGASCVVSATSIDPQSSYNQRRRQYASTQILLQLLDLHLNNEVKVLGVAEVDLFIPIFTFVFGEAQLGGRVAVMSATRLSQKFYGLPENEQLYYGRCEKEAIHELGHTYGLVHCHNYECVMHFSNSVEQVDLKGATVCSRCAAVLARSIDNRRIDGSGRIKSMKIH